MSKKSEQHKMYDQILNLRAAGITLAAAIHHFPLCGIPGGCERECTEATAKLQEIYGGMNDLLLSVRMALAAVFLPDSEGWDFLWMLNQDSTCVEREMAVFGKIFYPDQDEFVKLWGELDREMMCTLGSGFGHEEWKVLTARGGWQMGTRVPQILLLLKYLEDRISKHCDLYDAVIYGGLLGNCNAGQRAAQRKAAQA